ncbi:MAG: helix-turn-helix domain-containing protein [Oscillospiraceae bacterium]|nr:helix-turn-helix domain-containing protein [Oscillospiraceae bacterium]
MIKENRAAPGDVKDDRTGEWLTRKDVADYLKISLRSADTLIHNKDFDGLVYFGRSVRVSKKVLDKHLDDRREFRA